MFLGLLTLITALSISAVAIYYSVAGLVAIFAAAALPIMIMGGVLEIGKLVTAVWLHRYWSQATWWLRTYLATAVVVLMLITSMGIFGFLSKAHIEQTSASQESVAQVERLSTEIARQQAIIDRAEEQVKKLETSGTGNDANIQAQIDREQTRIDSAYTRIQPAIDEQQRIIDSQGQLYKDELARVDEQLATLQGYIDAGDIESIKKAQAMIGARQDGQWGSRTAAAAEEWRQGRQQARVDLLTKIESATNNAQARAARTEIQRLRTTVESQITESNRLINRLRGQISQTTKAEDIDSQVDEQNLRIRNANVEIDRLTEEKYKLEAEYRKLEAEVGPVKYIAEFVYGEEADTNLLEEAVRWVILVIIFVFDPLAVLLLIASQYTFEFARTKRQVDQKELHRQEWEEYERVRAQAIIDNPGYHIDDPTTPAEEEKVDETPNRSNDEQSDRTGEDSFRRAASETDNARNRANDDSGQTEGLRRDDGATDNGGNDSDRVDSKEEINDNAESVLSRDDVAQSYISDIDELSEANSVETKRRIEEYELKEKDVNFSNAKTAWKALHPEETLKHYKNLYIQGKIEKLPWESSSYTQNEEQNENSLFNKIKK